MRGEPTMAMKSFVIAFGVWILSASIGQAAIFGTVNGVVEDPQHRPVAQADVTLRARLSSWQAQAQTDAEGKFFFVTVPAGEYIVSIVKPGFQTTEQDVVVRSGTVTALKAAMEVGALSEKVDVTGTAGSVNAKGVTTESLVTR